MEVQKPQTILIHTTNTTILNSTNLYQEQRILIENTKKLLNSTNQNLK